MKKFFNLCFGMCMLMIALVSFTGCTAAEPDADQEGDKKPVYSFIPVLCSVRNAGGHDIPRYSFFH